MLCVCLFNNHVFFLGKDRVTEVCYVFVRSKKQAADRNIIIHHLFCFNNELSSSVEQSEERRNRYGTYNK